jgi:tetratricopeptide (TPR) repeat protein
LVGKGHAYFYVGNNVKAEPLYDEFLKRRPDCERVFESIAWVQWNFGKKESALSYSSRCLQLNPRNRGA